MSIFSIIISIIIAINDAIITRRKKLMPVIKIMADNDQYKLLSVLFRIIIKYTCMGLMGTCKYTEGEGVHYTCVPSLS